MNDAEMMEHHKERQEMTALEKPPATPSVTASGYAGLPREMFTGRERERVCQHCARTFTQRELSKAMAKWVSALPPGAQKYWNAFVKENALPLYCVKCEREDLGRAMAIV